MNFLFFSIDKLYAQENEEDDNIFIIESLNDSIDLRANFYDITDSLSDFFPAGDLYESWNTVSIHYPKVDFSNKLDTTIVVLADNSTNFYCHPHKDKINSDYGWRRRSFHYGIDIDLVPGDTIYCAFDGMVRIAKRHKGYGNVVIVRHFNGLETIYGHLSKLMVTENQTVKAGDILGLGGSTGRSTGPHLHFETRYLGTPFNPSKIINFDTYKLLNDTLFLSKYTFEKPPKRKTPSRSHNYTQKSVNISNTNNNTVSQTKTPPPNGKAVYYYVKSGDTLSQIAAKYGTSVGAICGLNGFSKNKLLQINQKIRVK